jgi:hypothetical protein
MQGDYLARAKIGSPAEAARFLLNLLEASRSEHHSALVVDELPAADSHHLSSTVLHRAPPDAAPVQYLQGRFRLAGAQPGQPRVDGEHLKSVVRDDPADDRRRDPVISGSGGQSTVPKRL